MLCPHRAGRGVDFYVFVFFLALVDGVAEEGSLLPSGKLQGVDSQRRGGDGAGAGSEVVVFFFGLSVGFGFDLGGRGGVADEGGGTSRAKMVSPRSAVRYCTTSFHSFL